MGKWGTGKEERKCNKCGKEFLARKDRPGLYCSKSCASSCKKQKNFRIEKNCEVCLKAFIVKRYRINTALYCSSECRRMRMPKKENHPNWKGGISRTWLSKKIIKDLIEERKECNMCKSTKYLQGHHIIPCSVNKDLQENPSNIEILCRSCHAKKHPLLTNFILKGNYHE